MVMFWMFFFTLICACLHIEAFTSALTLRFIQSSIYSSSGSSLPCPRGDYDPSFFSYPSHDSSRAKNVVDPSGDSNNERRHRVDKTHLYGCSKSSLFVPNEKLGRTNRKDWVSSSRAYKMKFNTFLLRRQGRLDVGTRRPLGKFITSTCKWIIVLITSFIMKILNRTHVHDPNNNLQKYIFHRDCNTALLTISNHCSILDDPGLWCGSIPMKQLTLDKIRNIIMVEESYNYFGKVSSSILHGLNCLPIKRGDIRGLESPQLFQLYKRLNGMVHYIDDDTEQKKEWCHIMIEGRILQPWRYELPHGNSLPQLGKFRLGAAKLIATSPPSNLIVLPIYHYGMHKIFPETPPKDEYKTDASGRISATRRSGKTKFQLPKVGNRIDIYVGEPIDFRDLVPKYGYLFKIPTSKSLLNDINSRLKDAMLDLEAKASRDRIPNHRGGGKYESNQIITQ